MSHPNSYQVITSVWFLSLKKTQGTKKVKHYNNITLDAILDVTKGIAITEGLFAQI